MREIKFRAWNGEKMIFRGLHDRNWYTENEGGKLVDIAHPNDKREMQIMQFTGLKDKNGVDIYDGDIVKVFYNQNSENYAGNNFNYTEHNCIVEFGEYSSSFVLRNITEKYKGKHNFTTIKFDHRRLQRDRIEIIGNFHDNPKLIN